LSVRSPSNAIPMLEGIFVKPSDTRHRVQDGGAVSADHPLARTSVNERWGNRTTRGRRLSFLAPIAAAPAPQK
ncbi:MAG TPA: hypothetical protein V6D02_09515, partial [Candidatus Obscuribacterales bacterium]